MQLNQNIYIVVIPTIFMKADKQQNERLQTAFILPKSLNKELKDIASRIGISKNALVVLTLTKYASTFETLEQKQEVTLNPLL